MPESVLEVVIYDIKPEYVEEYRKFHLPKFRQLVETFEGLLSYETLSSCNELSRHIDLVKWKDLKSAIRAAEMVKTIQQSNEFSGYLEAFESVQIFHHFSSFRSQ